jgi:hypothetical protein
MEWFHHFQLVEELMGAWNSHYGSMIMSASRKVPWILTA